MAKVTMQTSHPPCPGRCPIGLLSRPSADINDLLLAARGLHRPVAVQAPVPFTAMTMPQRLAPAYRRAMYAVSGARLVAAAGRFELCHPLLLSGLCWRNAGSPALH